MDSWKKDNPESILLAYIVSGLILNILNGFYVERIGLQDDIDLDSEFAKSRKRIYVISTNVVIFVFITQILVLVKVIGR